MLRILSEEELKILHELQHSKLTEQQIEEKKKRLIELEQEARKNWPYD